MKLTLIRTARETGKETFSTWPSDTLMEKMKTENKAGHISALRSLIPHITGSNGHYPCIDKLPRICPAAEYARSKEGERYLKTYNGLVQIEVNHLANAVEVEQVKRQAAGSAPERDRLPDPDRKGPQILFQHGHRHADRAAVPVSCGKPAWRSRRRAALRSPRIRQSNLTSKKPCKTNAAPGHAHRAAWGSFILFST